jgi:mono/diheme cytochrome c family protein
MLRLTSSFGSALAASVFAMISSMPTLAQELSREDAAVMAQRTLTKYCYDCHTGEKAEGGVRVDFLGAGGKLEDHVELVDKILLVLKEQQMPPADAEQPDGAERVQAIEWIEQRLRQFDCGSASRPGRVTMRRLNRTEYNNTVRDLTGLDLKLANDFPSDDVGNGFDNIGDVLSLPPILMEKYLAAAKQIADEVMKSPDASKKVFPRQANDPKNIDEVVEVARANASSFAQRAFRRPLEAGETERLFNLMRVAWDSNATKEEIMQTLITAILASPHFIYRVEEDDPQDFVDGVRPLNDFELASRLSYFLWSSMPDDPLLELAKEGKLHTAEQLHAEVDRMLADPKAKALVENFAGQWLQLRDLESMSPDPAKFASFDATLRRSMRRETELLFSSILDENRSILELLGADYTYVDERLAKHYGIDGVSGKEFKKVDLMGKRRGVLMHGSILLLTSNPTRTSPVKRGKWVLENLLAEPPPPPPPNVPELGAAGETLGTLRQQMEQHRVNPNCAVCHVKMDAVGFGLENFDAIGAWRDADGREKIDPSGILPGGRTFSGPLDLVQILVEDKKAEFARCLSLKMLTYALGRGLGVADRCTVSSIVDNLAKDDYRFATLIKSIVTSPPFTHQESGR